jgi:hypothetical protein
VSEGEQDFLLPSSSEKIKFCYLCQERKPASLFRKNSSKSDGLHSECKKCDNKRRNDSRKEKDNAIRQVLLQKQENRCAICNKEFFDTGCIDHDHSCCGPNRHCENCRRDLLCHKCNTAIGLIEEEMNTALNIIRYLLKWK